MKEQTFVCSQYGEETILRIGQKVQCIYYHEYPKAYIKDSYNRGWLETLIDQPFKPVKLGVIVGDAGVHPFWMGGSDRKEQYLLVKFKEYFFAKPIPISCIRDAVQSAKIMERFLKESESRIGEKGYDFASYKALTEQMDKAKLFTH